MYKWFNKDIYGVCMAKKRARGRHMDPVSLPPEMAALRNCLKATSTDGSCAGMMDAVVVQRAAAQLPGVKLLMASPRHTSILLQTLVKQACIAGGIEVDGQDFFDRLEFLECWTEPLPQSMQLLESFRSNDCGTE